jgi:hypothetical protein
LVLWMGALFVLRVLFHMYNKPSVQFRIGVYPILQLIKYLPIFLLLRVTIFGAVMIFCQITTMWVIYLSYRVTTNRKPIEKEIFRTALFVIALCLLTTCSSISQLGGEFSLTLLLGWSLARLAKAPCLMLLRRSRGAATRS